MWKPRTLAVTVVAVGALAVSGVAVGSTTDTVASCTPSPTVSTDAGAGTQSVTVTCTSPLPAASTTTATVTQPPVTTTETQTVTAPPQTSTVTVTRTASTQGLLVGARAKTTGDLAADFTAAQSKLGPLQVTRVFYGTLPAKHTRITPPGVLEIISYKASGGTANLTSFAKSLTSGEWMVKHHEPEGPTDYSSGAAFLADWQPDYDVVHPLGVKFGMIAGAYQYRTTGNGYDGSYLPAKADFYAIDTYRDGSTENGYGAILPLTDVAEFQRWYALVKDKGAPLAVTEYGRGTVGGNELASASSKRAQVLPQDVQWLRDNRFAAFSYWYSNDGTRQWIPADGDPFYDAFKALPRG